MGGMAQKSLAVSRKWGTRALQCIDVCRVGEQVRLRHESAHDTRLSLRLYAHAQ
jgi:hypothetical protein